MTVTYVGNKTVSKQLFREQLVDSPPPVIAIDVETISREEHIPIGMAIATSPLEAWYFRFLPEADAELELIRPLLLNPAIKKVFHYGLSDLDWIPMVMDIDTTNIGDTNVMARLLGYQETKLSFLLMELFGIQVDTTDQILKPKESFLNLPFEQVSAMCCSHARGTLQLYYEFVDKIDPEYLAAEMRAIPIILRMSQKGLRINQHDRAELEVRIEKEVEYYRDLCTVEDFNPGSPYQVGFTLARRGNFLPFTKGNKKTGKKQYKTDNETLEFLDDPLAQLVLSFRKVSKLLSTYIKPLANYDRLYTEYNLDAVVGRISSGGADDSNDVVLYRNLQNIPAPDPNNPYLPEGARYIFEPDSGIFTTGDFSQEHLRILAYLSQDREMLKIYSQPAYLPDGSKNPEADIHIQTGKRMDIPRKLAKTINYAIPYGADPHTVSVQTKIRDVRKCSRFVDSWFESFPDAAAWIRGAKEEGLRDGWSLPTLFGRRIKIPDEFNRRGELDRLAMGRKAVNYPILGSDGEVMKRGLTICDEKGLPLAVTVHDSITCDGDIEFPKEELENISPVNIPFEVKQTLRWE